MKKTYLIVIMIMQSLIGFSQNCGEFKLFNFTDTIVADGFFNEPKNGFCFDMTYDTLSASNTGYISFYLVDDTGDTITNKEYYEWSHFFPFSSNDTMRYTMVLDSSLNSLPVNFTGYLATANPECQIPVSFGTTGPNEIINPHKIVNVFPNPTPGEIWVDQFCSEISVFDMSGKILLKEFKRNSIDISNLNNGMYLLKMTMTNSKILSKRIIKY